MSRIWIRPIRLNAKGSGVPMQRPPTIICYWRTTTIKFQPFFQVEPIFFLLNDKITYVFYGSSSH